MIDEEDDLWEDLPSRKDLATSLVKSFVTSLLLVVLPSLVIAVAAWCFVYFVVTHKIDVSENDRLFWSNVWAGLAFIMAVVYFWKNK